jgi:natural product precursor
MKKLGKIHLRTIEEGLSESEMKFVVGGSGYGYGSGDPIPCGTPGNQPCLNKTQGDLCTSSDGRRGVCRGFPAIPVCLICWLQPTN